VIDLIGPSGALEAPHQTTLSRVLVVADRGALEAAISQALGRIPATVHACRNSDEAAEVIDGWQPHLLVVDFDRCADELLDRRRATRPLFDRVPVIAITRNCDLPSKLAAFGCGVDDVVCSPFAAEELAARAWAVIRRTNQRAGGFVATIRFGELEIDILRRRARIGTNELHLTSLEQSLLFFLAANAGRLLTRDEILDHLWGDEFMPESNVVDRHVRNLRAKLQDDWRQPRYIATVAGLGYRFEPVPPAPAPAARPLFQATALGIVTAALGDFAALQVGADAPVYARYAIDLLDLLKPGAQALLLAAMASPA
jgi:DNA-binding response OmpR family regulator